MILSMQLKTQLLLNIYQMESHQRKLLNMISLVESQLVASTTLVNGSKLIFKRRKAMDNSTERLDKFLECPLGGDETNDCADCIYSIEYHFADGKCVKRDKQDDSHN